MKAALVVEAGKPPVYANFQDPKAGPGQTVLRITAASLSHLTKGRASGTHYSSDGELPFVPGIDGVGINEQGERVYFALPEQPYGAMAEQCLVEARRCIPLPAELGDDKAAALAITGMSSWAALVERAKLERGETVLVNGATGASGRLAVQIAKHLGAKKVIATGRNRAVLADLARIGADVTIPLGEGGDALELALKEQFAERIDVVLDYLWGPSAQAAIIAAAKASPDEVPVRFVQIGSMGGGTLELPSAALRSSALVLMGSGLGSIPRPRIFQAMRGVLEHAPAAGFEIATKIVPLADVARAWNEDSEGARVVFRP